MLVEDAIILSAGFGTRLRPLTNNIPKPLIKINNKPVLEYILENLEKNGIKRAYLNASYLAEQIENFKTKTSVTLLVKREKEIKGTGGGIISFKHELRNKYFFVFNGDILFDFDLKSFANKFIEQNDAFLLLLKEKGNVLVKGNMLDSFLDKGNRSGYLYTGIQLINGKKFYNNPFIKNNENTLSKYSCIIHNIYKKGDFVLQVELEDKFIWIDIGTFKGLEKAKILLNNSKLL